VTDAVQELAQLAKDPSDDQAWAALFRRYWPYVFAINYRLLGGAGDLAEDASQDVFMRVARYAPFDDLKDPSAFKAYLATVSRNICRTYLRNYQLKGAIMGDPGSDEGAQVEGHTQATAEGAAEAHNILEKLRGLLTEKEQQLLDLLIKGYDLREISQALGLTYSTAGVRVHRLRQKLRNSLSINE